MLCYKHYNTLASCVVIVVATLLASQTAKEGSPHANQAVRARVVESYSRCFCLLIRLKKGLRTRWRHRGWETRLRGHCALRWLRSRLDLRRQRVGRGLMCGAQY